MESPVNVVVGEFYHVPCVTLNNGQSIPIMFPVHEDGPEHCLNETENHYHIDFRFCDLRDTGGNNGWFYKSCSAPFMKKMVAIRDVTNSMTIIGQSSFFMVNRWHRNNSHKVVTNGRCAHKNAMLVNPCGTCPFHGLQWDLPTGKLAKFTLPFYLELANREIQVFSNPRAPIVGDSCVITISSYFDCDGTVIMVDDNHKRYGLMKQMISPRKLVPGDKINFNTDKLCSKG